MSQGHIILLLLLLLLLLIFCGLQPKPVDLMKGRQIEDLSCGLTHNVVVTAAGEVVSLFFCSHDKSTVAAGSSREACTCPFFEYESKKFATD